MNSRVCPARKHQRREPCILAALSLEGGIEGYQARLVALHKSASRQIAKLSAAMETAAAEANRRATMRTRRNTRNPGAASSRGAITAAATAAGTGTSSQTGAGTTIARQFDLEAYISATDLDLVPVGDELWIDKALSRPGLPPQIAVLDGQVTICQFQSTVHNPPSTIYY